MPRDNIHYLHRVTEIHPPLDYDEREVLRRAGFRVSLFRRLFGYNIRARIRAMPREVLETNRLILSDIRERPYSHALVALATIIGWTAILVLPLVLS